jgi:hypothetical protein
MRSPGDALVGFKLSAARQWMGLRLPASPVSPEKDPPPHRTPRATKFVTRRQPMAIRKVGCAAWGQTTSDSGSREKGRMQPGGCPSLNLPIGILLMSSLAVVVVAVSTDRGAGVIAPSHECGEREDCEK